MHGIYSNKHKYSFIKQEPLEIETHLKLPEEHALLQLFPSAFQLKIMKAEKINNKIKGLRDKSGSHIYPRILQHLFLVPVAITNTRTVVQLA